jgi:RimJ/RimL family protein N-acetyltransferase
MIGYVTTPIRPETRIELIGSVEAQRFALLHVDGIVKTLATNLDHLSPWMFWATPDNATPEAQIQRLSMCDAGWEHNGTSIWDSAAGFDYTFVDTASGAVVGAGGLMTRQGKPVLEVGCWLAQESVGRGIAQAFTTKMVEQAWRFDYVERVVWICDDANAASAGVARRCGFEMVGIDADAAPEVAPQTGRTQIWQVNRPNS